jgi:signal transduction histidine kinase
MESVFDLAPERRRLRVRTLEKNGHVEMSVMDHGTGIAADHVSHIFEPFYTTKGKGLGMGLSIAKSIIEAHHGRIGAENNPEGGATVWFQVPAERPP